MSAAVDGKDVGKVKKLAKQVDNLQKTVDSLSVQLNILDDRLTDLGKERKCARIIVKGAVWSDISEEFWSKSQVYVKDGEVSEDVTWDMEPTCEKVLQQMGGHREKVSVEETDKEGKVSIKNYYRLRFLENGGIPENWRKFCSWRFATKVKHYMDVPETRRWDLSQMNPTYRCFSSSRELLMCRLRMLMQYTYELAKTTWTRTFVVDGEGLHGISAKELVKKQPTVIRKIVKMACKECHLFNREMYSEEDAKCALTKVLKSYKDSDTFNSDLHNIDNPLFEDKSKIPRRVFVTAKIPQPFSKQRNIRRKKGVAEEELVCGSESHGERAPKKLQKERNSEQKIQKNALNKTGEFGKKLGKKKATEVVVKEKGAKGETVRPPHPPVMSKEKIGKISQKKVEDRKEKVPLHSGRKRRFIDSDEDEEDKGVCNEPKNSSSQLKQRKIALHAPQMKADKSKATHVVFEKAQLTYKKQVPKVAAVNVAQKGSHGERKSSTRKGKEKCAEKPPGNQGNTPQVPKAVAKEKSPIDSDENLDQCLDEVNDLFD